MNASTIAATVAYWRFEAGPANTNVQHGAANGAYSPDIEDVSGNGNHLSVWATGGGPGYAYRADVAYPAVPLTGQANTLSVQNTGGNPGMWCNTPPMRSMSPAAFTIEATTAASTLTSVWPSKIPISRTVAVDGAMRRRI